MSQKIKIHAISSAIVKEMSHQFISLGIQDTEKHLLAQLDTGVLEILDYTLGSHIHKAHPVFMALIGDKLGVDPTVSRSVAAATDLFWSLSVMFDDVFDQDTVRSDRPTAWMTFGKKRVIEHSHTILEHVFEEMERACGPEIPALAKAYIQRGLDSLEDQRRVNLQSAQANQVLALYQSRNDYYSAFGVRALFMNVDGSPDGMTEEATVLGMRLLVQGAQIINDLEDLHDARDTRTHSDIRNGVVTLPILFLFNALSPNERAEFLSFFGKVKDLGESQERFLLYLLSNYRLVDRMAERITDIYGRARHFLTPAISTEHSHSLDEWINYKLETVKVITLSNRT